MVYVFLKSLDKPFDLYMKSREKIFISAFQAEKVKGIISVNAKQQGSTWIDIKNEKKIKKL